MRPHGRGVDVDVLAPRAQATCDRCGGHYNHWKLQYQYQWQGPKLQNRRILVCRDCLDVPQEQLRTIIIPPDPIPIDNPRPEAYTQDSNPISGLGINVGNMVGLGGLNAAFDGALVKIQAASAGLQYSISGDNTVGKQWLVAPQPVEAEAQVMAVTMTRFVLVSPWNAPFLGSGGTTYEVQGSNDYCTWTTIYSGTTVGALSETIDVNVNAQPYHFHQAVFAGNGSCIAVAQFAIYGTMQPGDMAVADVEFFATENGSNLVTDLGFQLIAECP